MAVPTPVASGKEFADHGFASQCGEGDGRDEFLACRSDNHLYFGSSFNQSPDEVAGFVGRDASRDSQYDFLTS